jgi:hypothetical protein
MDVQRVDPRTLTMGWYGLASIGEPANRKEGAHEYLVSEGNSRVDGSAEHPHYFNCGRGAVALVIRQRDGQGIRDQARLSVAGAW